MTSTSACMVCEACGSEGLRRTLRQGYFPLTTCTVCQARTIEPGTAFGDLSVEQDEKAYVASYSGTLPSVIQRRVAYVRSKVSRPASVLDFGAGFGYIARDLFSAGYRVTALEKSPNAVASMRAYGMRVAETLDEIEGDRFDAITLWHVLEHIEHPLALLQRLCAMLAPGGSLIIAVPNAAGLFARASFEHWIWTLPWHLHYFTEQSLRALIARTSCTLRSMNHGTGDIAALECTLGELFLRRQSRLTQRTYEHASSNGPSSAAYRAATAILRPVSAAVQNAARAVGLGEELVAHATAPTYDIR